MLCADGGFNHIDFSADGYEVRPVLLSPERKRRLNGRLMMFFTGFTRFSAEIQQLNNSRNGADKLARLQEMLALVDEAEAILTDEQADLNEFGRLLDHTWKPSTARWRPCLDGRVRGWMLFITAPTTRTRDFPAKGRS